MDWDSSFYSLLFFCLKSLVVIISVLVCVIVPIFTIAKIKGESKSKKKLHLEDMESYYRKYIHQFKQKTMGKKEFKKYLKSFKKRREDKKSRPSLFVLSFNGDILASQVENLREEISLVLNIAQSKDSTALILNSRGGSVSHYGLAANQLQRLREHKIPLTVCVDKFAGSGGYLMACVGDQILSSPFAFIGSIGVIFGIPNIHDFLKKHNVSYEEFTAGKDKRTVTALGEVTDEKRERLKKQLDQIHNQFKSFVRQYRDIDLEKTATGEAWLAEEALKKGLVDQIKCSDDYILEKLKTHNVYKISLEKPKSFLEKALGKKTGSSVGLLDYLPHIREII